MNIKLSDEMILDKITFSDLGNKVLQGVCSVHDYFFVTAYDAAGCNSVVYVLDNEFKYIRKTSLYNNSHVGGICFDDIHNIFWITDKKGFISSYRYDDIFNDRGIPIESVYVGDGLINHKGNISVAYITYNSGRVYVGNFSLTGCAILKEYLVDENGSINLDSCRVKKFLDKVQGIFFYKKWLVVSTSWGRGNSSELKIFKYDENINYDETEFSLIETPPLMEQICFREDKLITLYEINAEKFKMKNNLNSDIIVIDFSKVESLL